MRQGDHGECITVSTGSPYGSDEIAIVLVNYNGTADTMKCLDSLQGQGFGRCLTVVVDNGSVIDASTAIAASHPWAAVIRREVNGGWAGGNNEGIRYALSRGSERIVLLNNDTVVAPSFLDRLLAAAGSNLEYGILGPVICLMEEPSKVMTDGCDFNGPGETGFFQRHPVPIGLEGASGITEVDIVNGCCMMVEANVFRRIGLIDERFFLIHEESDFCLRARMAGFRCGVFGEPLVWHKGSSSFRRAGKGVQRYYDARNLFLLLRKHRTTCRGGRGWLESWREYFKYIYYRYSIEREHGEREAADAVIRGLCDALAGRYGPFKPGLRAPLPLIRFLLEFGRRARRRSQSLGG